MHKRLLIPAVVLLLASASLAGLSQDEGPPADSSAIDFGDVTVGRTATAHYTFKVLETSDTAAQVTIHDPCPPFGLAGLESRSMVLAPGQSVSFEVTFTPREACDYACSFVIRAVGGHPVQEIETVVQLSGRGVTETTATPSLIPVLESLFGAPTEEAVPEDEGESVEGTTDSEGRFTVAVPPSTKVAGRLMECEGSPLADREFRLTPLSDGFRIGVTGYESVVARPVVRFSLFGSENVDLGDVCLQPAPPGLPIPIRLLGPLPGEGLGDAPVQYCWESLGIPGLTYEVVHHTKECDPEVVNGPHPFAPLIPDPEPRARASELRQERRAREAHLRDLEQYCANLGRMFDQLQQSLSSIPDVLGHLEERRDEADRAQVGGLDLPLPGTCPRSAEELLAPHAELLDGLRIEPCRAGDPCRGLNDELSAIVGLIQSLHAHAFVQSMRLDALAERWVNGADHRGTMELYHGLFSLVDQVISLVDEIVGLLTPDVEELIEDLIERHVTDAVCRRSPDLCRAIEAAQTVEEKLATIKSVLSAARASGTPGPAFIVQMVQAMAQQAAAATAVAVEGWENFAEEMGAILWDAYESYLCLEAALEWLLDQRDRIEAMCEACQQCVRDEIDAIDGELDRIEAQEEAAAEARRAYWQEQLAWISSRIGQVGAYLDDAWYDACCGQGTQTIRIPSEGLCAERLEEALKQALGDKACFLEFTCALACEFEGGELVGASVECEHGFPLAERRSCCCVPCERQQEPIGSQPDPGRAGERVCHPPEGGTAAPEPGGWSVEGRDESGNLVASSPRRELGPGVVSEPSTLLPPAPVPPVGCLCSVSASVNGIPMTPGGIALTVQQGVQANIAAVGDCGPNCGPGTQSIAIQPPLAQPAWLTSPIAHVPLPVSVAAASTAYDFPVEGTYSITVTQSCEDGDTCSYTFNVDAAGPPNPVPRQPRSGEPVVHGTCPACGADPCLELFYRSGDEPPSMPVLDHRLSIEDGRVLDLELESYCRPECVDDRTVRWEMTHPDGTLDVLEGVELYGISYVFESEGEYSLCVIETVPCPEGDLRFENWWIFRVGPGN